MDMTFIVLGILIAYLIGNISPSYIIGKKYGKIDIREHGSGNAGATNALRILGKKFALIVFLADMGKGILGGLVGYYLGGKDLASITVIAVVFGHVFPVFLGFKGGKGVATSIGAMIVIAPIFTIIATLLGVALIFKFRYVSLGSITGIAILPLLIYSGRGELRVIITALILTCFVIYTHRENISRLLKGKERKIGEKA